MIAIDTTTNVKIVFNPSSSNGLLLYLGDATIDSNDFLSLTLHNRRVQLRINLGSVTASMIQSNIQLSLHEWHTVVLRRTNKMIILTVDNEDTVSGKSTGTPSKLNPGGEGIYIGGVQDSSVFFSSAGTQLSFNGCIYSVKVLYTSAWGLLKGREWVGGTREDSYCTHMYMIVNILRICIHE